MPQRSEIVLLPFPFAALSATKLRPVLVLTRGNPLGDFLAAQITSRAWQPIQVPLGGLVSGLEAQAPHNPTVASSPKAAMPGAL